MSAGGYAGRVLLATLLLACGDSANPPITSQITVSNQTSGDPIERDGYDLRLDGDTGRALPLNQSIVLADLDPGDHTLELSGIASGCTVLGVNPRTVHTEAGGSAESLFLVICNVPGTGRLVVETSTSGVADGNYLIEPDRAPAQNIGPNDAVTYYAVPAGPMRLLLSGLGSCVVSGFNPRTVQVRAGNQLTILFKVRCDLPPAP